MYRIEENLVYYQLFILLVVSCSMNGSHAYGAKTTLSIEHYLHIPYIHRIQQGPHSVLLNRGDYVANTTHRFRVPKLNLNFKTFYTFS